MWHSNCLLIVTMRIATATDETVRSESSSANRSPVPLRSLDPSPLPTTPDVPGPFATLTSPMTSLIGREAEVASRGRYWLIARPGC